MSLRALSIGVCLLLAVLAIAAGDPTVPHPDVHVDTVDGRSIDGQLLTNPIRLENEFGTVDVKSEQIRRITFRAKDAEDGHDVIELADKSHVQGRLLTQRFEIDTGRGIEALTPGAIREIKAVVHPPVGLLAVIVGLLTLAAMEIVLGIDNIIFLAIVAGRLPEAQQPRARRLGLIAALGTRILLLCSLSFLLSLTKPLFTLPELPLLHNVDARDISLRDLILLAGGLFLIGKSVREIHEKLEAAKDAEGDTPRKGKQVTFASVLLQIAILDIVFSLDSVITAIGMVDVVWVMIVAMVIAMLVMMVFAGTVSEFVAKRPTIKVLALAFLILIGVMLVAEGFGQHIDKGYIYFAMAFAVGIEMINLRVRRKHPPKAQAVAGRVP
ncbi:MAG TPA: TerC family protein [Gemmataceae bacterium]|jgi:predicted tellurium resistance membrane protein TerC|nr:TerC family protein [Gemmataceae bacterium]